MSISLNNNIDQFKQFLYINNFERQTNLIRVQRRNHKQKRMQDQRQRRILPPAVDEDISFGIMWIRVGKLKLMRVKPLGQNKIIIQFWGEKHPALLQTKSNPLNKNEQSTIIQYDIKCPVTYFKDYLLDMKKNLRLQVQGAGKVDFDITKFIKPNIDLSSRYVFDHFKGSFQILGKNNRKVGSIQIQMASNFNPEIAALQLAEENQSQEGNQVPVKKQNIRSPDINSEMAIDILAVQNPQLLKQFYEETVRNERQKSGNKTEQKYKQLRDDRIPNSLNTQMSEQRFNPHKYLIQSQKEVLSRKNPINQQKNHDPQIYSDSQGEVQFKQPNDKNQFQMPQDENQISNFPTITKVLTYSNLRLAHQMEEGQKIKNKIPLEKNISGVRLSSNLQPKSLQQQNKIDDFRARIQNQDFKRIIQNEETKTKNRNDGFENQFYGQSPKTDNKNSQAKNNQQKIPTVSATKRQDKQEVYSVIQKREDIEESNLLEQDKQILSRVVNLDEELKRSQINSPSKNKKKAGTDENTPVNKANSKQNDIRPITQYKTQAPFARQHANPIYEGKSPISHQHLGTRKHKPSSLVLNLIVQLEAKSIVFLRKRQKFQIIHRPYGCKQRIKLGPKFQSDKITIMCPITQQLVSKMDKIPFIIQFWGAVSNQFLGFIKINLIKIKKGFMLQGRLNQIAIKSSLMPIIIQNGQIAIENVNGQKSGECNIYAAIGTSAQIELFLNSNRKYTNNQGYKFEQIKKAEQNRKKKIEKPAERQNQNPQGFSLNNSHILLTNLLYYIDKNSAKNITHLTQFMKKKQLTCEQFEQFILKVNQNQQKVKEIVHIFRNLNPSDQGKQPKYIQTICFKHSYDQYKQLQQSISKQFHTVNKLLSSRITPGLKEQILKNSSFNIIEKQKFRQIYIQSLNLTNKASQSNLSYEQSLFEDYFLSFFDEYINLDAIFSGEKNSFSYEPTSKNIIEKVFTQFCQLLSHHNQSLQNLSNYLNTSPSTYDFGKKLWNFCKENLNLSASSLSLWYWLCLISKEVISETQRQRIFISTLIDKQKDIQKFEVLKQKIAHEVSQDNLRKNFDAPKHKPLTELERNQSESMVQSNVNQILNRQDASNIMKNILDNQSVEANQSVRKNEDNVVIQKQNIDISAANLSQNLQKSTKYSEHSFSLKGLQLYLEFPFEGQCQINYRFPYDDEPIGSKKIKLFKNKHKYAISLYGQHKITIDNDIHSYLNQIPVKFELINLLPQSTHQTLLQGDLHPDQMILGDSLVSNKVIPLFGSDSQQMFGKIKLQIQYKVKQTEKQTLGKQTVYNLFLPKNGFVNFSLYVKLQQQKIRSQYNLDSEQFYVALVIDFFNQNKNLKPHYAPITSRLFSDLNQQLDLKSSIKLSLNPVILEYFKQKNCLVSLNIIHYSKQKGNYQKKQITFATLKIPLFDLIKDEGIEGNYAFKNKYGMFVGLCRTQIKYDRFEKKQTDIHSQTQLGLTSISMKNKQNNYWVLIHFKQLINFQDTVESTFVKFQTVFSGTKYQTQRIHLSDDPLLLFNDFIALRLTEEDFFNTKILPISVQFDKKQKYAIDISLKPITKKLSSQKYFVNGAYFLVVDQNSELTKMRIGARVIVFKGNSTIEPFVNAFCNNLNVDVLTQIDLVRDLQNYPKMLDIFKNELKLSKRTFDDCLKQILTHKNQSLPLELMSSQLLFKLDLSPIIAQIEQQVDSLVRNCEGTLNQKALFQLVSQNQYKLTNFYEQIVSRYSFEVLWRQKIDKNVEYFNLKKQIDVLTLARKIKVIQNLQNAEDAQLVQERKYKQLIITLERGVNFHYLYNGIKPNVLIKIPQLSYESNVKSRASEPVFNESLRQIVQKENQNLYRHLQFEVYHIATTKTQEEEILIGSGSINLFSCIGLANPKHQVEQKKTKVIVCSKMSSKMKASLEIKLRLSMLGQKDYDTHKLQEEGKGIEDASRIEDMIKDINKQMDRKQYLFQNSSSDDQY